MKTLLLSLLFTAALLAQVPAHSVVGSLTMDVADIQVPVPYGPAETKALISICSSEDVSLLKVTVYYYADGKNLNGYYYELSPSKTAGTSCASLVGVREQKAIGLVEVEESRTTRIAVPLPIVGSTATSSSAVVLRRSQPR